MALIVGGEAGNRRLSVLFGSTGYAVTACDDVDEVVVIAFAHRLPLQRELQISPLRYAPVEMTKV